jgi:hypothetical protein
MGLIPGTCGYQPRLRPPSWLTTLDSSAPANRCARPAGHQTNQDAGNAVDERHRRRGASQRQYFPFEGRESGVAAEKSGHQQRAQIRMQKIFPVEQHQHQPDDERACNINQKRGQRKPPVVMFIDSQTRQIPDQGANAATGEDKKASNKQSPDFSARTATLSA